MEKQSVTRCKIVNSYV